MSRHVDTVKMPLRVSRLPRDHRGYPVPWFVAWLKPFPDADGGPLEVDPRTDGAAPDFRVIGGDRLARAVRQRRCWICGEPTGRFVAFVAGPMCAVNGTSGEPPSHPDCATYAARVCPFLTHPFARRRTVGLDALGTVEQAGHALSRNPGVALVWTTHRGEWQPFRAHSGGDGVLFAMGKPDRVEWWVESRPATRAEVRVSINSGLPELRKLADSQSGLDLLDTMVDAIEPLLPPLALEPTE